MSICFEIHLLQEKIYDLNGTRARLVMETTPEGNEFLDNLLRPYDRTSFGLFTDINTNFRGANYWPWAMIVLEREFQLAGHVSMIRKNMLDVLLSGYSIHPGYSVALNGAPPMSMLFFRNKSVASSLASKSPLFSACWSVVADKPENKNWLCSPDPLPEEWVREAAKGDAVLFSMIYTA